jgi:hypothetical protein
LGRTTSFRLPLQHFSHQTEEFFLLPALQASLPLLQRGMLSHQLPITKFT